MLLYRVKGLGTLRHYIFILKIQTPDLNRSTCSSYWNVLGDQILHFLEFFYYLLSHFENRWSDGSEIFSVFYCSQWICEFQIGLINSKKFPKNVKFSLQVHFNMKNMLSGSDRLFELWKWRFSVEYKCVLLYRVP